MAILKVAKATTQVQRAALERANVAVANARTAQKMAEAQAAAAEVKQSEADKELRRKVELARTGNVTDRDLGQVRALATVEPRMCAPHSSRSI
jgi:HlyD family secretion protein